MALPIPLHDAGQDAARERADLADQAARNEQKNQPEQLAVALAGAMFPACLFHEMP
jgi:hypothetical protein